MSLTENKCFICSGVSYENDKEIFKALLAKYIFQEEMTEMISLF